uniref:Uncharacterized protein n=1 Tax=Oryza nivara TaxID=4536 RepID=A0A0E0G4X7_ORYNI
MTGGTFQPVTDVATCDGVQMVPIRPFTVRHHFLAFLTSDLICDRFFLSRAVTFVFFFGKNLYLYLLKK